VSQPSLAPTEAAEALPYPEGWFQIAYSDDLAIGQVVRLYYFGQELVLFRTESGVAQVINAYCAHLGAHLGVGGEVVGEHLRCPFHHWEYGTDGRCKSIPYSPKVPLSAAVGSWPTVERAGLVLVWHSADRNAPYFDAPEFPEYGDPAWAGYTRFKWVLNCTAQDVCENAVDVSHLPAVHGARGIPPYEATFDDHTFDFNFILDEANGITHRGRYYGIGLSISRSRGNGSKCFIASRTPVDRTSVEVMWSMLTVAGAPDDPEVAESRANMAANIVEFDKDVPIWNNKIYIRSPVLAKGDGPIGRFRMWARKFYPESASVSLASEMAD
jgi:3-ketosteroid 9alpha-monooxygenase subunit A